MRILIADDEKYVRIELHALLEELLPQAEIVEVENGSQLKEILTKQSFQFAFIDIKMPGPSGLDVLKDLKTLKLKTIFIILTGFSDFDYARTAISLGVSEYMLKPVTAEELIPILQKVIPMIPLHSEQNGEKSSQLIHNAEIIIFKKYKEQIGVAQIAEELNVTPNYLSSQFKKQKNLTLTSYITDLRLKTAKEMLQIPGANVRHISENLGYQSSRHFARIFREKFGISPSEYMKESRF
jgi:two-component system response regulator YesN